MNFLLEKDCHHLFLEPSALKRRVITRMASSSRACLKYARKESADTKQSIYLVHNEMEYNKSGVGDGLFRSVHTRFLSVRGYTKEASQRPGVVAGDHKLLCGQRPKLANGLLFVFNPLALYQALLGEEGEIYQRLVATMAHVEVPEESVGPEEGQRFVDNIVLVCTKQTRDRNKVTQYGSKREFEEIK